MSVHAAITAAEQITALLEILHAASTEVTAALGRPYEAGAIALKWIDGELTPLLAAIEAKRQATWLVCPECTRGEARYVAGLVDSPEGVAFSCGHRARAAEAVPYMTMSLGSVVPVADRYMAVGRPQTAPCRPRRVIIAPHPEHWIVEDLRVGNRPQITGPLAGELFARDAAPLPISWETVQTSMDFVMMVRYVGPVEEGEVFTAVMIGVTADGGRYRPPTRPQIPQAPRRVLSPEQEQQLRDAWHRTEAQQIEADLAAMTPGERASYQARELEANRYRIDDGAGGCTVCQATLGLWCDHVMHAQRRAEQADWRRSTIVSEVAPENVRIDSTERTSKTTVTEVDEYE